MSTPKRELSPLVSRLRDVVAVAGLTQRELAELSGIPLRSIQDYLSGRSRMPADTLPSIAKALGVSCEYLLTGEPAALDPGILWQSLNDLTRHLGVQVAEDKARGFYHAYTAHYLERLSRYGQIFPCWDRATSLSNNFNARMDASGDGLIRHLRQIFPDV